jgi:hypothetical protein
MKKLTTSFILAIFLVVPLVLCLTGVTIVQANNPPEFYKGNTVKQIDITKTSAAETYIPKVVNGISAIMAGIAVIVLIIAGIQYIIAAGEPEKVTKAHKAILYSVLALFLIMFGYGMVYLILKILPN